MSRLVVMGSGETAPTMVRIHRQIFAETPPGPAVMLDTTFGFQLNADELVTRTLAYFADSVGHRIEVASWRHRDQPSLDAERALAALHRATWAFAGPGSPTYALRQWRGTAVPDALTEVAASGGTVVFGSAAAVTLGSHAIPVYEIYKAGEEPRWEPGLDLLARLTGISAVVVPHYDNHEDATHDTRFCYLGEPRLAALEAELPDDVAVLGVDEHTALVLDLESGSATVCGNGTVTVRRRAASRAFPTGDVLAIADLAALLRGEDAEPSAPVPIAPAAVPATEAAPTSLRAAADDAAGRFDAALAGRDVEGCVAAILDLEQAIADWSTDMLQSDDTNHARRTLRALVVRLGELATVGARDPASVVAPYVEAMLELRARAREGGDYVTSDFVRDRLVESGIEVRDLAGRTDWSVREAPTDT